MLQLSRFNTYHHGLVPKKAVVFNTLTRSISVLAEDLASSLEASQATSAAIPKGLTREEAAELEKCGCLIPRGFDEAKKLQHGIHQVRFQTAGMQLQILFSSRCNFACEYCYQDLLTSTNDMSMEQWKLVQSYLYNTVLTTGLKRIDAILFGGEPLVNPQVVLEAARGLKGLESHGTVARNILITNGALLSDNLLSEFGDSLDTVQITVDGPQDRHDRLRHYSDGRGTYDEVLQALIRAAEAAIPNVMIRINLQLEDIDLVRGFVASLSNTLQNPERFRMSFSKIAPPQSERYGSSEAPYDLEGINDIAALQADAVRYGFALPPYSFFSGSCTATRSLNMVVDQDLHVFKCFLQMPDRVCAEFSKGGPLRILDDKWYDLVNLIPECVYDCVYGPICGGGCPLANFTEKRGTEECEFREYTAATILPVLSSRVPTIAE